MQILPSNQTYKGQPVYILRTSKSFPVWAGVLILVLIVGFVSLFCWLRNEEKEKVEEVKEKVKPKTYGLDNRSYEDLTGEEFKGLSPDEI